MNHEPRRPRRVPNYLLLLLLLVPFTTWAWHDGECHANDPNCGPDGDILLKFEKPSAGIEWQLKKRGHLWADNWRTHLNNSKPWPKETYNPHYVHPKTFQAQFFNQCQNQIDWDYYVNSIKENESKVSNYIWSVNGVVQAAGDCFLEELTLPGEGIHDVKLEVFKPGAATPYVTKTEDVRVRDYLIVLFGDSAASGEGSPDLQRANLGEWGTWVDRRCHRSEWAAVPQAIEVLETDPHSTVTFLNFACSGATLKLWEPGQGVGILDRYAGIEPTLAAAEYGDNDPAFYLLSQVDQLRVALTAKPDGFDPDGREVDMLLTTGGINDVRFAKLAMACLLLENCHNVPTPLYDSAANAVRFTFADLAAQIPDAYVELRQALEADGIDREKVYVMQYPGAFEDQNGNQCTSMLEDVLPAASVLHLVNPLSPLGPLVLGTTVLGPFLEYELGLNLTTVLGNALLGNLRWMPDEITWMVDHAMPALDDALRDGAADAGFTFVDGIQEAFAEHGYCATDNWIRRAAESSFVQGPWNIVSKPLSINPVNLGLGIHALTKGLMHPAIEGYEEWAKVLKPTMDQLRNKAPITKPDSFKVNTANGPVFDTGFGAGVLINDFDPNDDPVRSILVTGPKNGSATLNKEGRLVYTPNAGFFGTDTLYYRVSDGGLSSPDTKVTLAVGNSRLPNQTKWIWTPPGPEATPVVQIGGFAEFPVCNKCGDLVLRVDPELLPQFGRVTFERGIDRWFVRYTQNGLIPNELPYVETLAIEIGRNVLGAFQREGRSEIPIRIEGTAPPPAWSWIFESPERVLMGGNTQIDLCDNCAGFEVRVTVEPQAGSVAVKLDTVRNRWVATYSHNPASDFTGDGFGVEIGTRNAEGVFTAIDSTRLSLTIVAEGG